MTKGHVPRPVPNKGVKSLPGRLATPLSVAFTLLGVAVLLAGMSLPALAENAVPASSQTFGQYLAAHQNDLAPFFSKAAPDLFRLAVPALMGMLGWVIVITMVVGVAVDVLMSRGFAYFFAPAFAEFKRSVIYAGGRLFLSFVYSGLLTLAVIFSLKLVYAGVLIAVAGTILVLVALAAQLVWILYLYRTNFAISAAFYLAVIVAHSLVFFLIAQSMIGLKGNATITAFVDQQVAPRLKAEADSIKGELAKADGDRNSVKAKVTDLQSQIAQGHTDEVQLLKAIEDKKHSDLYVFSQIVQARSRGELASAHDQLVAFLTKFPNSSVTGLARTQLDEINSQMVVVDTQKKQAEADAAREAAAARADLLARAGKGEVTLSEIRRVLIGKGRPDVKGLLGAPTDTGPNMWSYRQQMIVNPVTNEKHGLTVNFLEGIVQGVDYF